VRQIGMDAGLVDFKLAALDEMWLVSPLRGRR
jgi:hypothetical protein